MQHSALAVQQQLPTDASDVAVPGVGAIIHSRAAGARAISQYHSLAVLGTGGTAPPVVRVVGPAESRGTVCA